MKMACSQTAPPLCPHLARLICLLSKPNTVDIAEKMVNNLDNKRPSSEPPNKSRDCEPRCACAVVKETLTTDACSEFHWTSVLNSLATPALHVTTGRDIIEAPRLFHLPQVAQVNFLILLTRVYETIPHKSLLEFVQTLLSCPTIKHEWVRFYLGQLINLATSNSSENDHDQDEPVLRTGLSSSTVNRLRGFCSQQFPGSVAGIKVVSMPHTEEHEYVTQTSNDELNNESMEVDDIASTDTKQPVTYFQQRSVSSSDHDSVIIVDDPPSVVMLSSSDSSSDGGGAVSQIAMEAEAALTKDEALLNVMHGDSTLPMGSSDEVTVRVDGFLQSWINGQEAEQALFDTLLVSANPINLEYSLSVIKFDEPTEPSILAVINNVTNCSGDASYHSISVCIRYLIQPQVVSSVQKYVSRSVLSALTSLLAKHPNPTIEALLSPLLKSPSVSVGHCDLVCSLLKSSFTEDQRSLLWRSLLGHTHDQSNESFTLTAHTMKILQTLVEKSIIIQPGSGVSDTVRFLQENAAAHSTSLKFAHLFLTLLLKNGNQFSAAVPALMEVATLNKTNFKNKLLKAINDL